MLDFAPGSDPRFQIAIPQFVVVGVAGIGEDQFPVFIGLDRFHELIGDPHADIGVGDVAGLTLAVDEVENIRVPVIEDKHERPTPRIRGIDTRSTQQMHISHLEVVDIAVTEQLDLSDHIR